MNKALFPVAMPRICILTPGHLSSNPRLVKEADALVGVGYDVKVIAADFTQWARAADRIFADRAWHVIRTLPFGPEAPRAARAIQLLRQRSARLLVMTGLSLPSIVRAAWHPIAPDLVTAAQRVPADLYIAHYPAALPAAAIAAHRYGGIYAFDAEDFHLGDRPEVPEYATERLMVRAIEGRYLSGCAYVTAASPGIANAYAEEYGIVRPTVVLNVFSRVHAPMHCTPSGSAAPRPSVYWFSQTIGPDRGLECAVRAIGLARSRPHLYLRGTPVRGYLDRLQTLAAETGVADCIHVLPPAVPSDMERLAAAYDLGLSSEPGHTANNRIALGNKLFSYLLAGLPVALSDIPAHRAFASEVKGAARLYAVDDAESLAFTFDSLLGDSAGLAAARTAAFNLGQSRFNWETERSTLLNCVRTVFGENAKIDVA